MLVYLSPSMGRVSTHVAEDDETLSQQIDATLGELVNRGIWVAGLESSDKDTHQGTQSPNNIAVQQF